MYLALFNKYEWKTIAESFSNMRKLCHCIGAIDSKDGRGGKAGSHFYITEPSVCISKKVNNFYNICFSRLLFCGVIGSMRRKLYFFSCGYPNLWFFRCKRQCYFVKCSTNWMFLYEELCKQFKFCNSDIVSPIFTIVTCQSFVIPSKTRLLLLIILQFKFYSLL